MVNVILYVIVSILFVLSIIILYKNLLMYIDTKLLEGSNEKKIIKAQEEQIAKLQEEVAELKDEIAELENISTLVDKLKCVNWRNENND